MSETVSFTFEGRPLEGRYGESLAAALIAAGIRGFRQMRSGSERGIFCGMGVCQDCLVEVGGQGNQRACIPKLDQSRARGRESFSRERASPADTAPPAT